MADGGDGGHVQRLANVGLVSGDGAVPAHDARVAVDRRDADQGGKAAPVGAAELRQIRDQGAGGDRADARNRGQQVLGGPSGGRAAQLVVDLAVGGGERSFERFQRAAMPLSTFAPSLGKVDVCAYVH